MILKDRKGDRMKKLLTGVIGLLMLTLSSACMAEQTSQIKGILSAGVSNPTGDANKLWNMGFHGMGGVGFQVAPALEFVPKIEFHIMPLDKMGVSDLSGGTMHVVMIGGDMMVAPELSASSVRPLFLFGLGMGTVSASDLVYQGQTAITFQSETKIYYNVGAGLQFETSLRTSMFVAVKFVSVQTEGSAITFVPITMGVSFF
jgi:hypothetical protein